MRSRPCRSYSSSRRWIDSRQRAPVAAGALHQPADNGPHDRHFEQPQHPTAEAERIFDDEAQIGRGGQHGIAHLLEVAGRRGGVCGLQNAVDVVLRHGFVAQGTVRTACLDQEHQLFGRRQLRTVDGVHLFGRKLGMLYGCGRTCGCAMTADDAVLRSVDRDGVFFMQPEDQRRTCFDATPATDAATRIDRNVHEVLKQGVAESGCSVSQVFVGQCG